MGMNKQQLAQRIWNSANNMRSKIEASKYKDYILGFIFYKYLSEREVEFLKSDGWDAEDIEELSEDDPSDVEYIKKNIGYFIPYEYLYSTWVSDERGFGIDKVRDALSSFKRNIAANCATIYTGIFDTLEVGLSDLGDNAARQTKAVLDILKIIRPIPMTGAEDYDVLGFIYEYLIGNFAANAGKKAGEFYTPHEVAILMSEIIAWELRDQERISIYDPTSGSGSLLLTIGQSVARHNGDPDSVRYFAQELKKETYNLTRMNLVMRGVKPSNILTKNADTLADDWPLENDSDDPLRVNACASNPPYSQKWVQPEHDPRFDDYGKAPKSKADYAFLLHNLYHLLPGGVMTIVLPHGVLFRGGEEAQIRERLLDEGNIHAVIGLPSNIFYGTGIPTIVMVLKKGRTERDVQFIDASKMFIKAGKQNKLRERDIRRIFDVYRARTEVPGISHVASLDEIEANGFNLNIPRYVDSSEHEAAPDIYATMFGGTPSAELDELGRFWRAFPELRGKLFEEHGDYAHLCVDDVAGDIARDERCAAWRDEMHGLAERFCKSMDAALLTEPEAVDARELESALTDSLFNLFDEGGLIDPYDMYQSFAQIWRRVSTGLEVIQTEGFEAVRALDENTVLKKNDKGEEEEEIDKKEPWVGHVLDIDVVRSLLLPDRTRTIAALESELAETEAGLAEFADGIDEEERGSLPFLKEDGSLQTSQLQRGLWGVLSDEDDELPGLLEYLDLLADKKTEPSQLDEVKRRYARTTDWTRVKAKRDGNHTAAAIKKRITEIADGIDVEEDGLAAGIQRAMAMDARSKELKKMLKQQRALLLEETVEAVRSIDRERAVEVLRGMWVEPLRNEFTAAADEVIEGFAKDVEKRAHRYDDTLADVEEQIEESSRELCGLLGQLRGSDSDMEGIRELMKVLGGE